VLWVQVMAMPDHRVNDQHREPASRHENVDRQPLPGAETGNRAQAGRHISIVAAPRARAIGRATDAEDRPRARCRGHRFSRTLEWHKEETSMVDDYLGATESELLGASLSRQLFGYADQRVLFPHDGQLLLQPQQLVLTNWGVIPRMAITSVDVTFTSAYTRGQAGGIRGNASSLGIFGSLGKPLVLGLRDSEPVYLLIDFRFFSGINQARRWAPLLHDWLRQGAPA
jgi:hypothetical protein